MVVVATGEDLGPYVYGNCSFHRATNAVVCFNTLQQNVVWTIGYDQAGCTGNAYVSAFNGKAMIRMHQRVVGPNGTVYAMTNNNVMNVIIASSFGVECMPWPSIGLPTTSQVVRLTDTGTTLPHYEPGELTIELR